MNLEEMIEHQWKVLKACGPHTSVETMLFNYIYVLEKRLDDLENPTE